MAYILTRPLDSPDLGPEEAAMLCLGKSMSQLEVTEEGQEGAGNAEGPQGSSMGGSSMGSGSDQMNFPR
jgi:hypothetical protein